MATLSTKFHTCQCGIESALIHNRSQLKALKVEKSTPRRKSPEPQREQALLQGTTNQDSMQVGSLPRLVGLFMEKNLEKSEFEVSHVVYASVHTRLALAS